MPLTGSRYGMASGRDSGAPTLPRRVVKHERDFSSLHSGEQPASVRPSHWLFCLPALPFMIALNAALHGDECVCSFFRQNGPVLQDSQGVSLLMVRG